MRTKLIVSFSVPVLLVMLITMAFAHRILAVQNESQVLDKAMASYEQSYDLISGYVDTMSYVADSIYYNGDLQRIVGSRTYRNKTDIGERHREYLVLDKVLTSAENADRIYRAGIFISSDIPYTNNRIHFSSYEKLRERPDYERFRETVQNDPMYFSPPIFVEGAGLEDSVRVITLLRPVNTTDGAARHICTVQICVLADTVKNTLAYAQTTNNAFVYLADETGELIASTNDPLYWRLKREGVLPDLSESGNWNYIQMERKGYYVLSKGIDTPGWNLVSMIPEKDVAEQGRYLTWVIAALTVLIFTAVIMAAVMLSNYYTRRLDTLNGLIQKVRSGKLKVSDLPDREDDEIGELFSSFREMTEELQNLMREQYQSGKTVKSAELRALQAQINPHFLYNTLDLINWEAFEHDVPEIADITQNLARFYRISLNKGRQIVTVAEELEHVKAYVSIENKHFDGNIHLHVDVPEEICELGCINIILQPFVENAIMHGFAEDHERSECNIRISAERRGEDICFAVEDDGAGMTRAQIEEILQKNTVRKATGYGVKNIHSRLQLLFGENYGVTYRADGRPGVTVLIKLPALTPEEMEQQYEIE